MQTLAAAPAALATDDLSEELYAVAETVLDVLCAKGDRLARTPSEIGKLAKVTTTEVHRVVRALVADGNLAADGNGAWTRYTFIRG